ncbi:hypothetical protein [Jeotgalibacillus proteolyticus]|uniref:Lipoprotein n=1 Tax=Jeotgalibacillus proteolyticus TaxID=2082395 RepID=A0A2S5G9D9_9BACL|nr:hypothetical protein [Jeotgalibacillus proteolyticus]PPA69627.1 hypothetical protein C4B60_13850 [Jeotgalibacillus proteolyticus]
MGKVFSGFIALIIFIMAGCTASGTQFGPPKAMLKIGTETYETTLGSYCWSGNGHGVCADAAGPEDALENEPGIQVPAGEEIVIELQTDLMPDRTELTQNNKNVQSASFQFEAPEVPGIYYYSWGMWWMSDKENDVTGDVFYLFKLEVIGDEGV